ncbi:CaiB/BaiF CoA transferase family protein [Nisaea sediminum]|uniref:CaiB/BaiF CoA transferase family protein n=1 Tax=Nisaea sediminum TaxID=2775867 RepID=UPI001868D691|nr:CoA transferase [Nisaea sediminum]
MSGTAASAGALKGIKIVDCTRVLGGPYCTQMLGDHGAEIIKIEPPQGDEVRDWGPPFHEGDASYFIGVNRNKKSLGLDLSKEEGKQVLLRLLEDADVLVENYKPGSMEKWGLGYEEVLKEKFPKLVHCRISGFGGSGPYGGFPGYDGIIQAMTGWFSVNGSSPGDQTRVGIPMVDMGTGLYAANAIMMALFERHSSGLGQYIDMTLYDCGLSLMHPHVANYSLSGKVPGITGNQHPNISPYDKYETKGGDIFIAGGNDRAWQRLTAELGKPELGNDPRFKTNADRLANRAALREELEKLFSAADRDDVCDRLLRAGVPVGPIRDTAEVMAHEHTKHRDMAVEKDWYKGWGIPIKFSRTPGSVRSVPPKFGAHSREILEAHGFAPDEIQGLVDGGVVLEERRKGK